LILDTASTLDMPRAKMNKSRMKLLMPIRIIISNQYVSMVCISVLLWQNYGLIYTRKIGWEIPYYWCENSSHINGWLYQINTHTCSWWFLHSCDHCNKKYSFLKKNNNNNNNKRDKGKHKQIISTLCCIIFAWSSQVLFSKTTKYENWLDFDQEMLLDTTNHNTLCQVQNCTSQNLEWNAECPVKIKMKGTIQCMVCNTLSVVNNNYL